MRFLLTSALKDLRRRWADRMALLIWLGIPVAVGGLMALISGDGGPPRARVLVADQDSSFASQFLTGAARQGPLAEFLDIEAVALEEGRARLDEGKATALLILPKGFSEAVVDEKPAELVLVTNPAQRILPAIVQQGLEMLVEAAFYAQRLFGAEIRTLAEGPSPGARVFADTTIASLSTRINRRMEVLRGVVFPPVLQVEDAPQPERPGSGLNFGKLFLPGLLFMAVLFIAQGMSEEIWTEKEGGTLRRVIASRGSVSAFLAGKLSAGAVLVAAVSGVGLGVAGAFYEVAWTRMPLALAWSTYAGTALLVFFVLLQLFATSARGGSILTRRSSSSRSS